MASEWTRRAPAYAEIMALCPFIDWALGAGSAGFFPADQQLIEERDRRLPVMIRLKGMLPAEFASGRAFFPDGAGQERWRRRVHVPALYTEGDMNGRTRIVCTATVTRWFFEELARNRALRAAVIRVTLGLPLRNESLPAFKNVPDEAAG
jgi:hypothetical protein